MDAPISVLGNQEFLKAWTANWFLITARLTTPGASMVWKCGTTWRRKKCCSMGRKMSAWSSYGGTPHGLLPFESISSATLGCSKTGLSLFHAASCRRIYPLFSRLLQPPIPFRMDLRPMAGGHVLRRDVAHGTFQADPNNKRAG
jgi:hypothetical protein